MSRSITPAPTPPQTITVSSTAGFNAGDLVYFNGSTGDYGTPPTSAAGATVSVPATGPVPLLSGVTGATARDVGIYGGGAGAKGFADILTNGNIVQVFFNAGTSQPSFRIVDTANTVVVAETSISAVFTQASTTNIAVTALTGGGFAVAWINSSGGTVNRPCYAVYSNAGVVVTAAAQDLAIAISSNSGYPIRVKATPSGGFIIAFASPANSFTAARGYDATGIAVFAWVSLASSTSASLIGLAVRGDGSFLLANFVSNSSITYAIWSSTGTAIVSSTSFGLVNGSSFGAYVDAACLSDGTTFVIVYTTAIGNPTTAFRFLPTGNVLGSEFYIPPNNFYNTNGSYEPTQDVTPLSGNRFIIGMTGAGSYYPICYAIFNSSGVCLSGTVGTTSTAAVPITISQAYSPYTANHISAIESPAGYITLYYSNMESKLYSMLYSTVDNTTGQLINVAPTTQLGGNAAATPVAYSPAGSTPLGAAYSINAGNYNVAGTFGAVVKNPEVVDSSANATSISSATLPDGRVLIAYILNSGAVKVAVYSITGVLTQTLLIATATASFSTFSLVSIAALTSGKFVIAYATGSGTTGTYTIKLYSSSFTEIGGAATVNTGTIANGYTATVSGLTNDRYIVAYSAPTNNYPTYQVYDNTNTQIVAATTLTSVAYLNVTVAGRSGGGFFVSGRIAAGQQYGAMYANPTGNTFTAIVALQGLTGATQFISNTRAVANTYDCVALPYATSATGFTTNGFVGPLNSGTTPYGLTVTSLHGSAVGFTGSGIAVSTGQLSGVMQLANPLTTVALSATLFKPNVAAASSQNCMTPSYGNNVGIAYIDINQKVNYAIVCGTTMPLSASLTSANPSTAINIYPGATSATPAIQNTVFTGVALQTVPAGGAGLVQVSGTAQLGSTYPSTTTYQAFDHQSQGVPGVKGTITGRAITLQGT